MLMQIDKEGPHKLKSLYSKIHVFFVPLHSSQEPYSFIRSTALSVELQYPQDHVFSKFSKISRSFIVKHETVESEVPMSNHYD